MTSASSDVFLSSLRPGFTECKNVDNKTQPYYVGIGYCNSNLRIRDNYYSKQTSPESFFIPDPALAGSGNIF